MKKSKVIIPALAVLLLSTAASVTGTVAWFTANKSVTANGMLVKAKAEGSLVITGAIENAEGTAVNAAIPTASATNVTKDFQDAKATYLYASTHDDSWANVEKQKEDGSYESAANDTGLKYVINTEVISPDTGLAYTAEDTIHYGNAANDTATAGKEKYFYRDYYIWIAASGDDLLTQKIKVQFDQSSFQSNGKINDAMSIDFYASTGAVNTKVVAGASTFVNTLNVAGLKESVNDAKTEQKYFYISDSGITIPSVTGVASGSETAISVLMRVYFDGELKDNDHATNNYLLTTKATEAANAKYDNRGGDVALPTGDSRATSCYQARNDGECDTTYARNVKVADIDQVALAVKFTAEDIAA